MTTTTTTRHRLRDAAVASVVAVLPHEISPLISAASTFFFILSAYFCRAAAAGRGGHLLGLSTLPGLFAGSLLLTPCRRPRRLPRLLPPIHPQTQGSSVCPFLSFFVLWFASTPGHSPSISQSSKDASNKPPGWGNHSWFYILVRISLFLWVSLLNLIAISSTWARVIDIMDSESGSRLFWFLLGLVLRSGNFLVHYLLQLWHG
ncbi:hypothetical protein EE612_053166 [Oryza sativa]|nr:hypothetical protein EE612_053166 [Oryza sativa]